MSQDHPRDDASSQTSWLDQMSSFLPGSVHRIMDEQRRSRLSQCRVLEQVLSDCRQHKAAREQLEDFPMGIRMVRYFDWRNVQSDDCVREEHALWACRAVGLQCGPDLVALRDCFKQQGPPVILSQKETAYEKASTNVNAACLDLQTKVGGCVRQKAVELEERWRKQKEGSS